MSELWELSLWELARALRDREVAAAEACASFLRRAAEVDRSVNCFVSLDGDRALERTRELDDRKGRGVAPLHGVPFAVKDIFVGRGTQPTAGVRHMGLRMRAGSAAVVERLEGAGAVELGRLSLDPWGYAATGTNPQFGPTRNPWALDRLPGGSSSGAATAVAARALPFTIGADTGGSVRIPAAFCGVVGLKPTFGRISRRGAIPLSWSQDTIGILARTALDAALVLAEAAGHDGADPACLDVPAPRLEALSAMSHPPRSVPLDGLRIGVDRGRFERTCEREVTDLANAATEVLAELGAAVVELDLSALDEHDAAASVLTQAESAAVHGPALVAGAGDYPPTVRARLIAALACTGSDHVDALRYQGRALRQLLDGPLAVADLVLTPAVPGRAPRIDDVEDAPAEEAIRRSTELLRLHRPFNLSGVPALSLPIGFDSTGLPVGMQIAGRPWAEARLLGCAAAYQNVTEWHIRSPGPLLTTSQGAS